MASYEPLKLFIVKYLRDVFFFLPAIGSYAKKYITFSELAADEKASGSAEERSSLASAILKISQQEEKRRLDNHLTLSYFSPAIVERANRLSDEAYVPRFKYLDKNFIKGSLALAVVSLVAFVALSDSTKAFEMHGIGNCVSNFKPSSWLEVPEMNNNANEGKSSSAPLSPEASEGHSEVSEGKQDAGSLYNPASNQSFCNIAGYNDPRNPVCNDN